MEACPAERRPEPFSGRKFHQGVILACKFEIDDLCNNAPVTLCETSPYLGIAEAAATESRFNFRHDSSYSVVIDEHPSPAPMELRITVDNRDVAASTRNCCSGYRPQFSAAALSRRPVGLVGLRKGLLNGLCNARPHDALTITTVHDHIEPPLQRKLDQVSSSDLHAADIPPNQLRLSITLSPS